MSALPLTDCCTNKTTKQHVCFNKGALAIPAIAKDWTCP
jgi:hypothetical protein